ncbi:MAG TPA: glycosyltransferase [bacterium]|nr:glycosyltransferase [bacterium]HPN44264.1 glycosyltransferase [bacterium]
MIICDITQGYTPMSGGIRTYIHEKRSYIKKHTRHRHILIIPGEKNSIEQDGQCKTITIKSPYIPHCEPFRFIIDMPRIFSILCKEKPDVIELDNIYLTPYPALLYRLYKRCALFGFYHTDFPTAYVEYYLKKVMGINWAQFAKQASIQYARFIYDLCDQTLSSSPQFRQILKKMGVQRVQVIPLGVDLDLFNPKRRNYQIRRHLGVEDDELLLVYAGRLDAEKRIDFILEAFEKIPSGLNARLLFIGEGPLKELLVQYTRFNTRVTYIPYIQNRSSLAHILASADIYITAGKYETFGLSVIEAQACGLPVVGVHSGALIDRVPKDTGLLVNPDSSEDMAKSIYELGTNGFREKGKRARQLVEDLYSWEKSFSKLVNLYEISCR